MAKMLVCMGAKEYYAGDVTLELPFDLIADDIDNVQPDGYGQFWVFLEDSGKHKVKAYMDNNDLEFQGHSFRDWCETTQVDDWVIISLLPKREIVLTWDGDVDMEFCEVDENLVDHWEVDDGCS